MAWVFTTPTTQIAVRLAGRGLIATYDQGLSVYRVDGQWRTRLSPSAEEIAAADRYYAGGHEYQVSNAEAADLTAGGLGDYLTAPPNIVGSAVVGSATTS